MKIGIVTTHHCSKSFSPDGDKFTNRLIDSLKSINYDYVMYLYDNQSTVPFVENNKINDRIKYKYIEDQSKRGITGTWNDGFYDAYTDNCDLIFQINYDVVLNDDINLLIKTISELTDKNNVIFGPVTNGVLCGSQLYQKKSDELIWSDDQIPLNGFMFGMTKTTYDKYKFSEKYFFEEGENYKWSGQEDRDFIRCKKQGCKFLIVSTTWFFHQKLRGWKYTQNFYKKN